MEPLRDPPRRLNRADQRALLLGQPATLLGGLALSTAASAIWLLVAGYGLTFSTLRYLSGPRMERSAWVEFSRPLQIWTGETVQWTSAVFDIDGATYRAQGFSFAPPYPKAGESVTVLMPSAHPETAWLAEGQKFPVRLTTLASIASVFLFPALLLTLWGVLRGRLQLRLAQQGREVRASRTSHRALPRPLTDQFLDRWSYCDRDGVTRTTWSVAARSENEEPLLVLDAAPAQAVRRSALLPHYQCDNPERTGIDPTRRRSYRLVLTLWLLQAAIVLLFLLT